MMKTIRSISPRHLVPALAVALALALPACQDPLEVSIDWGEPITLTSSADEVVLRQDLAGTTGLTLSWSRGTNQGTGSAIAYLLEIDRSGNNFASATSFDMGRGVYEKGFTMQALHELVHTHWLTPSDTAIDLVARVTADVVLESVEDDISDPVTVTVTPFDPVPSTLYLYGTAAPNGNDVTLATEMIPNPTQPWIFNYTGQLTTGTFQFSVTTDDCYCKGFYFRDPADSTHMLYAGEPGTTPWEVTGNANYSITANLVEQTITIEKFTGPKYDSLYIVGDASPSGWNIATPEAFTRDSEDPYVFTFEGDFTPGEFKISTFTGDWCEGDWINATQPDQVLTATDYIITQGCDGPDNKWRVTEETQGRYLITVDLFNRTITIEEVT